MKFVVSSSKLLKEINALNSVISSNPIVPILENFLFQISNGILKITASDSQTTIISEIEVDATEEGNIAVPAKMLTDTLKNLPSQPVTFNFDFNTYGLEISSDNGRYKISCENATDYLRIPSIQSKNSIDIPANVLLDAISYTLFAASSDEMKPEINGVNFRFNENSTTFVSTDGHRLIRYRRVDITSAEQVSIIIQKKALSHLKALLPATAANVSMESDRSNIFFTFENLQVICRLIDERFPDIENAIPTSNNNTIEIKRLALLNSLKRISIYANKSTNQIRLLVKGSELQISAEDLDFSNEANERLACKHDGDDLEIGFNSKFLIEVLSNLHSDDIIIKLDQPNRAGLIFPVEKVAEEDVLMLVMPVVLNSYSL